ncbi:Hint domain-containing protein [Salibaculum griseiflavum]|uniref:Hedgehog/Intein (Hint) domain-containing protein n=1 Tax=Salibaculum griseiflavum TaxID=1914409 RepID=A0A2V1P2S6_9RHOB|nr:Hint domain-containing protein [Salibaculum griseiflavum]PWG16606.1 hypothetical protein DFK10_10710 [Salibaculum griseiflavum]
MSTRASHTIPVYPCDGFRVSYGVAEGDPISFMEELVMDDIYQLSKSARRVSLAYRPDPENRCFRIEDGSETGGVGNALYLDCCLTFMASDGTTLEAIVLVEVEDGDAADIYLLPLATLAVESDYRLVGADREGAQAKFGEVAFCSFARGTHITLASGAQVPIEALDVGDKVLTRDSGPQEIRWIGQTTLRAVGDFAPVVIREGALFNTRDLLLSPEHRLFIYQRQDDFGVGRAEVLVKVRHLINGETVYQRDGGFVDYFQLLFDDHQIIYAEGIAAETLLVDSRTRAALPGDLAARLGDNLPGHEGRPHLDFEVQEDVVRAPDAVDRLRRASSS